MKTHSGVDLAALAVLVNFAVASAGLAHDAGEAPTSAAATSNPATLVQLESVRRATARFLDEQTAIDEGYRFELEKPELLVYAVDPCSGSRRLVAVEYAVPLALADEAPAGFVGSDDTWTINQRFQLWTLHAWLFEYNPAGVFAAYNVRVP